MMPIKSMFASTSIRVTVPAGSYEHIVIDPADATCDISFNSNRTVTLSAGVNPATAGSWLSSNGTPADYWIRWSNTSGTLSIGTAGVWEQLNSNRTYGVSRAFIGNKTCTGTVDIATDAAGVDIVATGSITLLAEVD